MVYIDDIQNQNSFGRWVLPDCCKRHPDTEYQKVQQLHRERKIGEIWTRRNYQTSEAQPI